MEEYNNMLNVVNYYNNSREIYGFILQLERLFAKYGFESELHTPNGLCKSDHFRCFIGQRGRAEIRSLINGEIIWYD